MPVVSTFHGFDPHLEKKTVMIFPRTRPRRLRTTAAIRRDKELDDVRRLNTDLTRRLDA